MSKREQTGLGKDDSNVEKNAQCPGMLADAKKVDGLKFEKWFMGNEVMSLLEWAGDCMLQVRKDPVQGQSIDEHKLP